MHISSIGAGMFSDMSIAVPSTPMTASQLSNLSTASSFQALFDLEVPSTGSRGALSFVRITDVREFPSMGTPANIVNVPVYGSKTSKQIQGQSDAPSIELTLNYIPSEWADGTILGDLVKNDESVVLRFVLLNAEPDGADYTDANLATVGNSQYYWIGKLEALLVNPQLTDSNTATVTVTVQSNFYGAFTTGS
jgi:hypothetical protein